MTGIAITQASSQFPTHRTGNCVHSTLVTRNKIAVMMAVIVPPISTANIQGKKEAESRRSFMRIGVSPAVIGFVGKA